MTSAQFNSSAREGDVLAEGSPAEGTKLQRGFLPLLGGAALGIGMGQLTPLVLTLPLRASTIDPANEAVVFSIAIGAASLLAVVAYPLFGRLSDRTTGRLGRRRPYLFLGALLIALGAVFEYLASNTATLAIAAALLFVGAAAVTVAVTSIIPDQIPTLKRGPASAVAGMGSLLGALVGLFVAQAVPSLAWQVFAPAALGVIGITLLAVLLKDRPITKEERPVVTVVLFFSTFWTNPVKNPDFALVWFSRLLLFCGVAAIQSYQLFYLVNRLGFTSSSVSQAVAVCSLTLVVAAVVFAFIGGRISDRMGRRKPFVIVAALAFAVGLVIAANATTFLTFLIAVAIVGAGQGVYIAVDIALASQVLPDPENPAKDMGILGLAVIFPSFLVPALAPFILLIGASVVNPQNYSALFVAGAIAGLVGAALILPIRKVK
ncbi:MFS transporter [Subtercola lobariae]|uniref:MFS transporter n=1 Tax=Subtercola lobariae TaxID=1588641 RepID=A0A917B6U9_9MICO|nr:MFS transporter [Subtercola lobariae]GGF22800.1 MFS transporter [Subtercola lobariae]